MNKEKISKILLIASMSLAIVAFFILFAPAFNVKYFGTVGTEVKESLIGTGTMTSLFTILLRIRNGTTFTFFGNDGATLITQDRGCKSGFIPYMTFSLMAIALILAIVILVLVILKKYEGKVKLITLIALGVCLLGSVVLCFLLPNLLKVSVPKDWASKEGADILVKRIKISLGVAPILYGALGVLSLGSGVASFLLNRE